MFPTLSGSLSSLPPTQPIPLLTAGGLLNLLVSADRPPTAPIPPPTPDSDAAAVPLSGSAFLSATLLSLYAALPFLSAFLSPCKAPLL